MEKQNNKTVQSLKDLTKGSVWDLQEGDIFRLWMKPDKDEAVGDHAQHYLDIIKTAFDVEPLPRLPKDADERLRIIEKKFEDRGLQVGVMPIDYKDQRWGIKKRPINRVTDLTYENIHHISAAKLLEVIDRNFGGGWDSINQGIRDIILSAFDVTTTTVPASRLHKPGGLYELKVNDGFEVLEIAKGTWVEAIFVKVKPVSTKIKLQIAGDDEEEKSNRRRRSTLLDALLGDGDDNEDDNDADDKDSYFEADEDDLDVFDEDRLTEESYRTTVEENPEDISLDDADLSDEDY